MIKKAASTSSPETDLVLKPRIVGVVAVIDLAFVVDDSEEVVIVHCVRARHPDSNGMEYNAYG